MPCRTALVRLVLSALAALIATTAKAADTELRIGWQKASDLAVLKERGTLEQVLVKQGVSVQWFSFPAGPQMLEALSAGAIDLGSVGETPPVFAQAAGRKLVYLAYQPPEPAAEALLVPKNSKLRSVAGLKHKRVVLNRGSNVHYFLVRLLEKAGLSYADVKIDFLAPSDAYAAFAKGDVDAWAVWDPYTVAAEDKLGARILADASGVAKNHFFVVGSASFFGAHSALVPTVLEQLNQNDEWIRDHMTEAASIIAPQMGQTPGLALQTLKHWSYGVKPLSAEVTRDQQAIADTFYALKLIPKPIQVTSAVWHTEH